MQGVCASARQYRPPYTAAATSNWATRTRCQGGSGSLYTAGESHSLSHTHSLCCCWCQGSSFPFYILHMIRSLSLSLLHLPQSPISLSLFWYCCCCCFHYPRAHALTSRRSVLTSQGRRHGRLARNTPSTLVCPLPACARPVDSGKLLSMLHSRTTSQRKTLIGPYIYIYMDMYVCVV